MHAIRCLHCGTSWSAPEARSIALHYAAECSKPHSIALAPVLLPQR